PRAPRSWSTSSWSSSQALASSSMVGSARMSTPFSSASRNGSASAPFSSSSSRLHEGRLIRQLPGNHSPRPCREPRASAGPCFDLGRVRGSASSASAAGSPRALVHHRKPTTPPRERRDPPPDWQPNALARCSWNRFAARIVDLPRHLAAALPCRSLGPREDQPTLRIDRDRGVLAPRPYTGRRDGLGRIRARLELREPDLLLGLPRRGHSIARQLAQRRRAHHARGDLPPLKLLERELARVAPRRDEVHVAMNAVRGRTEERIEAP